MEVLRGLLVVIEALLSLMVIGVILLQKSREQGLGLAFGANIGETIFGSRAGNVLTRATIWLASLFMINTVVLAILFSGRRESLLEKAEGARATTEQPARPASATPAPAQPGTAPAPTAPAAGTPITVPVTVPAPTVSPAPASSPDAAASTPPPSPQPAPPTP
ncbi:MAG: preprotein translocase subunit SecG [Kiritimatiellae bacterium]|nr:preprotein translocase subunit SecG [Kiritimatiellia bacterium]